MCLGICLIPRARVHPACRRRARGDFQYETAADPKEYRRCLPATGLARHRRSAPERCASEAEAGPTVRPPHASSFIDFNRVVVVIFHFIIVIFVLDFIILFAGVVVPLQNRAGIIGTNEHQADELLTESLKFKHRTNLRVEQKQSQACRVDLDSTQLQRDEREQCESLAVRTTPKGVRDYQRSRRSRRSPPRPPPPPPPPP